MSSKIRLKDINVKNIRSFVEGNVNHLLKNNGLLNQELVDMIEERKNKCIPCRDAGSCIVCGCNYEKMIASPTKACPNGIWDVHEKVKNQDDESKDVTLNQSSYRLDLSKSKTIVVQFTTSPVVISEIELTCTCMQITNQIVKEVSDLDSINIVEIEILFDTSKFDIGQERVMMVTLESKDKTNPLRGLDTHKTFTFKRDK
jgi:hypothetical protein